MDRREMWLNRVSQCIGGATMLCMLLLVWMVLGTKLVKGSEMILALLLPMPGLIALPIVALIGDLVQRCGYFDALAQTMAGYCQGALLSIAALALTLGLCGLVFVL